MKPTAAPVPVPDSRHGAGQQKARLARGFVLAWFLIGGCGHFLAPEFFLKIIPPALPWRLQAVYISGAFELAGALGLLFLRTRAAAGWGLLALTLAVTPANIFMWSHPALFPRIPEFLLGLRLLFQLVLLWLIWYGSIARRRDRAAPR